MSWLSVGELTSSVGELTCGRSDRFPYRSEIPANYPL